MPESTSRLEAALAVAHHVSVLPAAARRTGRARRRAGPSYVTVPVAVMSSVVSLNVGVELVACGAGTEPVMRPGIVRTLASSDSMEPLPLMSATRPTRNPISARKSWTAYHLRVAAWTRPPDPFVARSRDANGPSKAAEAAVDQTLR
jgi:hypothetical protein